MDPISLPRLDSSRLIPVVVQLLASGVLVGLAFLVAPVLIPGALLASVMFLLYPLRRNPLIRQTIILTVAVVSLWFFVMVSGFVTFFILGALLVYVINPLVNRFEQRGVPRWFSSLIFVLLLVGGMAALVALSVPRVIDKADDIDRGMRAILHHLTREVESGNVLPDTESLGASPQEAGEAVTRSLKPEVEAFALGMLTWLADMASDFGRIFQHLVVLVILPFFMFFMLKDLPGLFNFVVRSIHDADRRDRFLAVAGRLDDILGRYFRGAIIVAAIQGAISGVGLWIIGVKYPVFLGVITGFLDFFPYIGLFISLIISALVAYASGGAFVTKIILITALYLAQKLLEATVLAPKIIGPHVGLHPVLLIMSLIIFEQFMGFVGLLIAVPVGAVFMAAIDAWASTQGPKIITTGEA